MKNFVSICVAMAILAVFTYCTTSPTGGKLDGSFWMLSTATLGKTKINFSESDGTSLIFSEESLTGQALCNSYFATYSANGATLNVSEVGANERSCAGFERENVYLSLLSKSESYSVRGNKLEIFSANGKLTFNRMKKENAEVVKFAQGIDKLTAQFPVLEEAGMLHLHPILRVDNPGNYPYLGVPVDTSYYAYFSRNIREIWESSGGEVLAVGQYGGFFLCRIPGRYVSSDIAIFTLDGAVMKHVETIAWAWCDEGWCNQQDAWLTDIDGDGDTDVVQHYTLTDDRGKIKEERLVLLKQVESNSLVLDGSARMEKERFKMARI